MRIGVVLEWVVVRHGCSSLAVAAEGRSPPPSTYRDAEKQPGSSCGKQRPVKSNLSMRDDLIGVQSRREAMRGPNAFRMSDWSSLL